MRNRVRERKSLPAKDPPINMEGEREDKQDKKVQER